MTLRGLALAWLVVYVASYSIAYPLTNWVFLCNLGALLTALALWRGDVLLLSSQAVGLPVIGAVWTLDVATRLATGHHLVGGTEYMWDPRYPLFTRLLSLYHVVLPIAQLSALRRTGYDRRGYLLQSAIAVAAVTAGRFCGPSANVNFSWFDPLLKRSWDGPVGHVALISGALVLVVYPLVHLGLTKAFGPPRGEGQSSS
jgi:hypothetical protein